MDFSGAYEWPNLRFLLQGFWVTLQVAGLSIVFSFILGTLLERCVTHVFPSSHRLSLSSWTPFGTCHCC